MAHSLSPDELARLPACAHIVAAKGRHIRYMADAAARHYRDRPLAELLADLGLDPWTEAVRIDAGIGSLTLRAGGNEFHPAVVPSLGAQAATAAGALVRAGIAAASGDAVFADPAVIAARSASCRDCARWEATANRCGACGCQTAVKVRLAGEACPLGRW